MALLELNDEPACVPNDGGQAGFVNDWENDVVALEGGWMSGKTWAGARKLISLHLYNAFDDKGNPTYIPSAVVGPTYGNVLDFQTPALLDAAKECNLSVSWKSTGSVAFGRFSAPALVFNDLGTKLNPSVILTRTAERPETIAGWEVGAGWGDEPARWKEDFENPRNDSFVQFRARVRHPRARKCQLLLTYTNEGDNTRVYKEIHSGVDKIGLHVASTLENPKAQKFYNRQKESLTEDMAEQYLLGGVICLRGGRIYPSFKESVHVDKLIDLVPGIPLHLSVDFNISPGMHLEIGQLLDENTDEFCFTTVYEIYQPRLCTKDAVYLFHKLMQKVGMDKFPELHVYGDAAGRAKWAGTGQSNIFILHETLRECGYNFIDRIPIVNPAVANRVNAAELAFYDVRNKVHWKCHPRCRRLVDDRKYLNRAENGGIDKKDKNRSHASDADDYRIAWLKPIRVYQPSRDTRFSVVVGSE